MTGDAAMLEIVTEIIHQALPWALGALLLAVAIGVALVWCWQ